MPGTGSPTTVSGTATTCTRGAPTGLRSASGGRCSSPCWKAVPPAAYFGRGTSAGPRPEGGAGRRRTGRLVGVISFLAFTHTQGERKTGPLHGKVAPLELTRAIELGGRWGLGERFHFRKGKTDAPEP